MIEELPVLRCSVGVTAHNEEQNIAKCVNALRQQLLREVRITEIIVVASGIPVYSIIVR